MPSVNGVQFWSPSVTRMKIIFSSSSGFRWQLYRVERGAACPGAEPSSSVAAEDHGYVVDRTAGGVAPLATTRPGWAGSP